MLDMLLTLGKYTGAILEVRNLSVRMDYRPGSMVAFSGKMIRHGASEWKGERSHQEKPLLLKKFRIVGIVLMLN